MRCGDRLGALPRRCKSLYNEIDYLAALFANIASRRSQSILKILDLGDAMNQFAAKRDA
jgi:hypothetical protein